MAQEQMDFQQRNNKKQKEVSSLGSREFPYHSIYINTPKTQITSTDNMMTACISAQEIDSYGS